MATLRLLIALIFTASAAASQTWQSNTYDTGGLIHGGAGTTDRIFYLSCTAPSSGGRPLIETGDHEAIRTDTPYDLVVSLSVDFATPGPTGQERITPDLVVDGTRFQLPPLEYSDFYGAWTGWTRFDGPGILELFDAREVAITHGSSVRFSYPTDGLAQALTTGLSPCLSRWVALGHGLPPRLAAHINRNNDGAAPSQPSAVGAGVAQNPDVIPVRPRQPADGPQITFVPPSLPLAPGQGMDLRAIQTANQLCGGVSSLNPGAIWPGDVDGDGIQDVVLNWGFVQCVSTGGVVSNVPGVCDTSGQCRITVFSSAQAARGLVDWHAEAYHAEPDPAGPAPLFVNTRSSLCGINNTGFGCSVWLRWTGNGFAPVRAIAAQADLSNQAALTQPAVTPPIGAAATLPDGPPPAAAAHISALCEGAWNLIDPSAVTFTDIDGDGALDYLLNWTGISCAGGQQGRAYCGAANCRIDLFLSTRNYANPEELLGIGAEFVQDQNGRIGVMLSGTRPICEGGFCDTPWFWNGTTLQQ